MSLKDTHSNLERLKKKMCVEHTALVHSVDRSSSVASFPDRIIEIGQGLDVLCLISAAVEYCIRTEG